jgi:hypothetical protein
MERHVGQSHARIDLLDIWARLRVIANDPAFCSDRVDDAGD